jgi:hypothetical protein
MLSDRRGNLADRGAEHNDATRSLVPANDGSGDAAALIWPFFADMQGHQPTMRPTMTTFDKREEGFEKRFAHDEELKFKATARRNRMLGQWAAEKLGLSGADADAYAREVVLAALEGPGVLAKLRKDFDAKGVAQSDHQINRHMDEFLAKAVEQLKAAG